MLLFIFVRQLRIRYAPRNIFCKAAVTYNMQINDYVLLADDQKWSSLHNDVSTNFPAQSPP